MRLLLGFNVDARVQIRPEYSSVISKSKAIEMLPREAGMTGEGGTFRLVNVEKIPGMPLSTGPSGPEWTLS